MNINLLSDPQFLHNQLSENFYFFSLQLFAAFSKAIKINLVENENWK